MLLDKGEGIRSLLCPVLYERLIRRHVTGGPYERIRADNALFALEKETLVCVRSSFTGVGRKVLDLEAAVDVVH